MADFYELAQQAEANPEDADFAALRRAYVESPAYRPFKHILQAKLMQITDNAGDFDEVAKTCRSIVGANPVDLEARMMLALAQEKTGDSAAAEKTHLFAERMLDAILTSGDGKSFESAFKLVADAEAWTVMRTFGIKAKKHTRHRREDGIFDVYDGKLDDRDVSVYFDVTDPVNALDETLGDGDTDT